MTVRMAAMRRGSGAVTAAVLTALLVAACGGGDGDSEGEAVGAPRSDIPRTSSASTPTDNSEAIEEAKFYPIDFYSGIKVEQYRGGPDVFTVFIDDDLEYNEREDGKIKVFTKFGPSSIGFDPSGGDMPRMNFEVGVQQSPDQDTIAVTSAIVRIPAEGLDTESYEIQASVFGITGEEVRRVHYPVSKVQEFISSENGTWVDAVGLYGDTVVVKYDTGEYVDGTDIDEEKIVAIDSISGDKVWEFTLTPPPADLPDVKSSSFMENCSPYPAGLEVGYADALESTSSGDVLFGDGDGMASLDVETGKLVWKESSQRCYGGVLDPSGTFPYRIIREDDDEVSLHDMRTGERLSPLGANFAIDQVGNMAAVTYTRYYNEGGTDTREGMPALQVIDLEDGKVVYELENTPERIEGGINILGAFNGIMWVQNGSDVTVADMTTGQTVPESDALESAAVKGAPGLPMFAGDNWLVLKGENGEPGTFVWTGDSDFGYRDLA